MINLHQKFRENCWTRKKGVVNQLKGGVLAAGLGTRMDPLSVNHIPKPLFPLGGKVPMAELWIRRFVESGIDDISMNLCVHSEKIKKHFKDGSKFACDIGYIEEEVPTGTLGGVCKHALGDKARLVSTDKENMTINEFHGSTIIAPSGDIVTNFGTNLMEEMYDIHKKAGAAFTLVLVPVPWDRRKDFGTVLMENPEKHGGEISGKGVISDFREKDPKSPSNLNNASIYMIEMDLLKALDPLRTEARVDVSDPFYDFGKHVFPAMLGKLPYVSLPKDYTLFGLQYNGSWFDVGRKRDYLRVNESLLDGKIEMELPFEKLPWGYVGANVTIDYSKVTINAPVVIGNDCVIESGAILGPYAVIGDGWVVEKGANISHSVLWETYSYFTEDGEEISPKKRRLVDRHQIRANVKVKESIIVGGAIDSDIIGKTADVHEDGELQILDIDKTPDGPRA
ncbi:MAG: hypothetical protein GY859_18965 [Desulfobacterales bacterium]|nr:hypothetical protein [Desulfobacterales bacterium]